VSRLLILCAVAACSGADQAPEGQHVRTGSLSYDAPVGWTATKTQTHTSATSTWTPSENAGKESVSVVWTAVLPLPTNPEQISELLVQSEHGLHDAKVSKPIAIKSVAGLNGYQIESDFTAVAGGTRHRVHAVLLDGNALVHVFYVAAEPDEKLESYRLVLNSVTNGEG
jgi:hypothetical protein